ncbi:MAG: TonB-dependent receptor domain-containing protein [Thermoanaerobaculia bacterium]
MLKRFLLLLAAVLALAPPAGAQTTTGTIRGEVTDADGAALPGVTITVTGERGVERVVVSGGNGSYLIASVPPASYSVEAALEGMQSQRADDLRVTIGGTATVSFTLDASFTEEMVVVAESPLLDLASSEAPTNYQAEFIEDLPTRRSFWDMVSVSPGMSQTTEFSDRQSAFGSSTVSNSWNVDGLNVTGPETGAAWWYINPETIEEVQVLGIGASAEFGNMTGAAINVVTKSGGNEYEGAFNSYVQLDELTDTNVELPNTPFPSYVRDEYHNETLTFGGPIQRDRAWFFGAAEYYTDSETLAGADPAFPAEYYWERYDMKLDWAPSARTQLDGKYHYEDYGYDDSASAFVEPSARGVEFGTNPAWGAGFSHTLSDRTLLEIHYAGWSGDDFYHSQTGSTEDAFVDFSPPGGGPPVYFGGLTFPYDYELYIHQGDVKMSHYAEDFLGGDHDFRFGVEYSAGSADTVSKAASGGDYYYHYTYQYYYNGNYYPYEYYYNYTFTPFHYGAKQKSASAFIDDSWRVSDRLTLNLGVRYDVHDGRIPDYERLDENGNGTGVTIPGRDDVIDWKTISPRLGFAWIATEDARTVVSGSVGVYHDGNVSGNWNYPPPQAPPLQTFLCEGPPPTTCDSEPSSETIVSAVGVDPNLDPPRSLQYALGLERQLTDTMALGAQLVYKETKDLIGWEILGDGIYEPFPFTDPVTGQQYTLLNICDEGCQAPTIRKGNRPGVGSLAPDEEYHQDYRAAILTLERRHSDGWSMMGSYTWSRSEGLIPRPSLQTQGSPFYFEIDGSDPNQWINADQLLQNDREHMFRVQGNVDLPWDMEATGSLNWQTGRPYNRQGRARLDQGSTWIILEPNSDDRRLPTTLVLDASIGKRWNLSTDVVLKTDLQVLNLFNEDANQFWETQRLLPGEDYTSDDFVYPRRGIIRLGLEF